MIVKSFNDWQSLNEQKKLDIEPNKSSKAKRKKDKSNRRKYRKDNWISDSGAEYVLIRKKDASDNETDTFVLKGKNKKSPVWDKEGKLIDDVKDFLSHELMSGQNEGKYDEDSIEMEKYREGKNRDRVKFTIGFAKEEKPEEKKEEKPEEKKLKYEKIELPKNAEGETRIEIGQESEALPKIKEILRVAFSKKGFTLGKNFGMDWLDQAKLEEKDAKWIKALRIGFGMSDATYISQGLVDNIVDHANKWSEEKSEAKEEVASNESFFLNFSDYMKVFEEFDVAAAMTAMNSKEEEKEEKEEKPKEEKKPEKKATKQESTGFTKEQGDQFRKWANTTWTIKHYGKESKFDLDETGSYDNNYIRKALAQAKKDKKDQTGPFEKFFFRNMWGMGLQLIVDGKISEWIEKQKQAKTEANKEWSRTQEDDNKAIFISDRINAFWTNPDNFTSFKGTFNDNEAGAIALFTKWWNKEITPKINELNDKDPNKMILKNLFSTIITKAEGGTALDTATWYIETIKGDNIVKKRYAVDTDF